MGLILTWSGVSASLIVIAAVATAVLGVAGVSGPVRPIVTLFFALTCPGMSLIRLLRLRDPLTELTLGIAASIAIAGLVGGVLLYLRLWTPEGGMAILIAIALAGVAGERAMAQFRAIVTRHLVTQRSDPTTLESLPGVQSQRDRPAQ